MAVCDVYTVGNTGVTVNTTSATPILSLFAGSTKRCFVTGIRVSIGVTSVAPGATVLYQLARPANSPTGTGPITPNPNDPAASASIAVANATYTIAPTLGLVLWQMELPFTTGTSWEEFPPFGYEWAVPTTATSGVHVFVTCSTANSTPFFATLVFGE